MSTWIARNALSLMGLAAGLVVSILGVAWIYLASLSGQTTFGQYAFVGGLVILAYLLAGRCAMRALDRRDRPRPLPVGATRRPRA